jgi:phenylacetate-CoA ligase
MNKLFFKLPILFQSFLISLYNIKSYRERYGGKYKLYLKAFQKNNSLSLKELNKIQERRYQEFFNFTRNNSKYYQNLYKDIEKSVEITSIKSLPILNKETLRSNIKDVYTISKSEGILSKTGGTTGKSLEVLFTHDNMQERFAQLDNFRESFGYKLGCKTAWFSGKSLLSKKDINKKRFWKTDYWYKVRYYSTFHIKDEYLKYYLENLIKFNPEFLVGFPSTMVEIAKYGYKNNYDFPKNTVKAIFPTAETLTKDSRAILETFFNSNVYDQYASSEGAPFIFECKNHKLHLELQSGVFEVLDDNDLPTNKGRLVVTSFTTHGTPLIRYDIGDSIELSNETCTCGNNNPLVIEILGRIDDFIYSPEVGKINLGNISNTLKGTVGIIKFQVHQNKLDELDLLLVVDPALYKDKIENMFLLNWRERVGKNMKIKIKLVDDIPNEKSGKYRIVKNNIKHLIDN